MLHDRPTLLHNFKGHPTSETRAIFQMNRVEWRRSEHESRKSPTDSQYYFREVDRHMVIQTEPQGI